MCVLKGKKWWFFETFQYVLNEWSPIATLSEFLCWPVTSVDGIWHRFKASKMELNFFFTRGSLVEKHNVTIFLGTTDEDNEKLKVDVETVVDQPFSLSEVNFLILSFVCWFHPIRQKMDHFGYPIAVINGKFLRICKVSRNKFPK